jgi:ubiquinone/menaquinone biosynthesis C-methylase UbiE
MLAGLAQHLTVLTELPRLTSILDVGCGSGSMARLLAAKYPDARVVGVDLRSDYVAYDRDRARGERLDNLRFEQGDIFTCRLKTVPSIWCGQIRPTMAPGACPSRG